MMRIITHFFSVWPVLLIVVAFVKADLFSGLKSAIVPLLIIIMLSMGQTLKASDFANALSSFKAVLTGVVLQFSVIKS